VGGVASGGRAARGARLPGRAAASVVVPFPRPRSGDRLDLLRLVPAGRSLAIAFSVLAAVLAGYGLARETSLFAADRLEVSGAGPRVERQVQRVLAHQLGQSLLRVDLAGAERAVEALPAVESVSFDRAFPHTLRVSVREEQPLAVVRQAATSWLVSARGRVMARLDRGARPELPRIWIPGRTPVAVGAPAAGALRSGVAVLAPLRALRFPARVRTVTSARGELTLRIRSGAEVRLGEPVELRLKLAVAARVLPLLDGEAVYLDVSVPERPVSGTAASDAARIQTLNSQVKGEVRTSRTP
jgi:cell division protein FtsQ